LDRVMIDNLLYYTPKENLPEIQSLINQYKQPVNENKLNLVLRKLINEELKKLQTNKN
jgi:hypothetical protein